MPTAKLKLGSTPTAWLTPRGLAMIAAVPCLILIAFLGWRMKGGTPAAAAPATQRHAETPTESPAAISELHVDVVTPNPHGLGRKTVQPGTVHAFEYAELYAKTSGYLGEQNVDIGDRVKRGQVLARIEVPELKAGVDEAQASLARANGAQVRRPKPALLTQRAEAKAALATVKQAEAEVVRAKAQVVYRKSQYGRIKELVASQSVEKKLEDEQHEAYESSEATLLSAHAAVENAKAQADAAQARVTQAEADIEHAKAEVQVAAAVLRRRKSCGITRRSNLRTTA